MTTIQVPNSTRLRGVAQAPRARARRNQAVPMHSEDCPGCLTRKRPAEDTLGDWRRPDDARGWTIVATVLALAGFLLLAVARIEWLVRP